MKMLAVSLTLCTVLAISQAVPINSTMSRDKGQCYYERKSCLNITGSFCPKCDDEGNFLPRQCWGSTGYCWCVGIISGKKIPNTATPPGTPPVNCRDSECPDGWSRFDDRCFKYVSTPKTWTEAQIFCQFDDGNLASIHSYEENHFVQSLTSGDTHNFPETWAGATNAVNPGFWMWIDGSKFDYEYWCDDHDHDHDDTSEQDSHGNSSKKHSHNDTSEEDSHGKSSKKHSHDDTSEEDSEDDHDDDHYNPKKTASVCMKINCHHKQKWCIATCNKAFPFVCSKRI